MNNRSTASIVVAMLDRRPNPLRQNHIRQTVLFFFSIVLASACQTTKTNKNKLSCYCGVLESLDNEVHCGLWKKEKGYKQQTPLTFTQTRDCTPKKCMELAKQYGKCRSLTFWKATPFKSDDIASRCYCDTVKIENKKYCAIWKPGDHFLREYHLIKNCTAEVCKSDIFRFSKSYCSAGFQTYYTPLQIN